MSRRKQSNPKYALRDFDEMRSNEITTDGMTKQSGKLQSLSDYSSVIHREDDADKEVPGNYMQTLQVKYSPIDSPTNAEENGKSQDNVTATADQNFAGNRNEKFEEANGTKENLVDRYRATEVRSPKDSREDGRGDISHSELNNNSLSHPRVEHTCPACGLYFLNKETYNIHVKMYCIIRRKAENEKTAGGKAPWINLQTHTISPSTSFQDTTTPELERLRHTISNIHRNLKGPDDTSLCPSCNLRYDDPSHLSSESCSAHRNESVKQELAARLLSGILANFGSLYRNDSVNSNARNRQSVTDNRHDNISPLLTSARPRPRSCEVDAGNISLPTAKQTQMAPPVSMHCIVCGEVFVNDFSLQQHLLSTHGRSSHDSPLPDIPPAKVSRMMKSRRLSTVERPQLSLLSSQNQQRKARLADMKEETESDKSNSADGQDVAASPGIIDQMENKADNRYDEKKSMLLGLVRKNSSFPAIPSTSRTKSYAMMKHGSDDERRMSCPVVPSVNIALESYQHTGDNVEERHCVECDIKFNSAMNYRAHKKFYCASRHEQRNGDANPLQNEGFHIRSPSSSSYGGEYAKHHKRNIGNRSSMTPRKRSHFIPLQTTRQSSAESDRETISEKEPKIQKSDQPATEKLGQTSSSASDVTPQRRYYCEECKISFSKGDTFIAHKKYYCHTRRKDRSVMRQGVSTSKSPGRSNSKDSPDASPSYELPSGLNGLGVDDGRFLARESDHSPDVRSLFPAEGLYPPGCNMSQLFPHPSVVMGNLAMMQPLFMKQYLFLREKMLLEASKMGGSSPNLAETYPAKDRKLSADETHMRSSEHHVSNPSLSAKKHRRPARQSCAAVICVKQEDSAWEQSIGSVYSKEGRPRSNHLPSPLDLRQKSQSFGSEEDRNNSPSTVSLNTTQPQSVERENSPLPQEDTGSGRNSINNSETREDADSQFYENESEQRSSIRARNQICKNCNTKFSSLSTFIAHKKYYCSGSGATHQTFSSNPLDITIKSESNWVNRPHS